MFIKLRKAVYRPLAALLAALLFLFTPLPGYVGVPDGKIESEAFAIALPAGIAAYELVQYALIAIATAAGAYGLSNVDWDRLMWEFSYSYSGNTSTVQTWSDSMVDGEYIFYDDGSLRNSLIDYAMYDMRSNFFDAVGYLSPEYDFSDLPGFDTDYEVIDNTAEIMERYFNDLLLNPNPITSDLDLLDSIDAMLEEFIGRLQGELGEIGAHEPGELPPVSAYNEQNQALCEYLNYIIHAFEANSSFYQPPPDKGRNIHVVEALASAWFAFLLSKGLINEGSDPSVLSGYSVDYNVAVAPDTVLDGYLTLFEVSPTIKYPVFQGVNPSLFRDGVPVALVKRLDSYIYWMAEVRSSGVIWFYLFNKQPIIRYESKSGLFFVNNSGLKCSSDNMCYNPDYNGDWWYHSPYWIDFPVDYDFHSTNHYTTMVSPGIEILVDEGNGLASPDPLERTPGKAYINPGMGVDTVPTDGAGGIRIYTPDLPSSVPEFFEKVESAAVSPTVDLAQPEVDDLFGSVSGIFTPPSDVDPDVPVNPDPDNPDVPVNPDNPDVPVNPDTPSDPDLSDPDTWKVPLEFKNKFPFSIPWDLAACVRVLKSDVVEPVWEVPFVVKTDAIDINEKVVIDLTGPEFDIPLAVVRGFVLLAYVMLLAMATRSLIRG